MLNQSNLKFRDYFWKIKVGSIEPKLKLYHNYGPLGWKFIFIRFFDLVLQILTLFCKITSKNWLWSNVSRGWKSVNSLISVWTPQGRGGTFKNHKSQDLAPIRFTNPNFNHRGPWNGLIFLKHLHCILAYMWIKVAKRAKQKKNVHKRKDDMYWLIFGYFPSTVGLHTLGSIVHLAPSLLLVSAWLLAYGQLKWVHLYRTLGNYCVFEKSDKNLHVCS